MKDIKILNHIDMKYINHLDFVKFLKNINIVFVFLDVYSRKNIHFIIKLLPIDGLNLKATSFSRKNSSQAVFAPLKFIEL